MIRLNTMNFKLNRSCLISLKTKFLVWSDLNSFELNSFYSNHIMDVK